MQEGHAELARERELERLDHPAPGRGAVVVQMRGEDVERARAATRGERGEYVGREPIRGDSGLDARNGRGIACLRDDPVRRFLDDVLIGRRLETPHDRAVARRRVRANERGEGRRAHLVARVAVPRRPRQLGGAGSAPHLSQRRDGGPTHLRRRVSQRRREGGGGTRPEATQGCDRRRARAEVIGSARGVDQGRERGGVAGSLREPLDDPLPVPQVGVAPKLRREPHRRLIEGQLLENRVAVVEHDHGRGAGEPGHFDRLLTSLEPCSPDDVAARRAHPDRHGHVERLRCLEPHARRVHAAPPRVRLGLLDRHRELARRRVVGCGHREPRVSGRVDPLAPEPVEVFTRGVEHRLAQIVTGRVAQRMAREVQVQRGPEALRPQVAEQHTQHQGALRVHVVRSQRRERHAAPPVDLDVLLILVEVVVLLGGRAELHAPVLTGEKLRKAFVEPHVGPVLQRHVVAEPLVRQLVGDQQPLIPGTVEVRALVGQPVDQRGGAHVLHAAEEVRHRSLGVLGPRIADPGQAGIHIDHVRRHAEQPPGAARVGAVHVILQGNATPRVGEPHQRRDHQRDEVRRARLVLPPRDRVGAVRVLAV